MYNRVILIGRLTKDPEVKQTTNDNAVTGFVLAVNRSHDKEQVDFIEVVAWKGLAETVGKFLKKGRLIAVEGKIQVSNYTNKEGKKRSRTFVLADEIKFLDRPKE